MGNRKNIRRAIKRTYMNKQKHMMEVVNKKKRLASNPSADEPTEKTFHELQKDSELEDPLTSLSIATVVTPGAHTKSNDDDMSEVEWTNEQVINLMREYRNRPVLWDTNDNMFRVQTARYEAWSQIAEMFGCAITDMRKKINSIFASHRREKGKVRAGTRSTWFLYDHLSFLPNHVENEQGVDASVSSSKKRRLTQEETEEPFEEYLDESEIIIKEEPQELYQVRQTVYTSPEPVKHSKRRLTKQPVQECKKLPETVEVVKRSEVIQNKDECDSFGEYIAMSLRKHDERTQAMIKQAINNILFEQEMKKYSTEQYTVVISNMDENPLVDSDE